MKKLSILLRSNKRYLLLFILVCLFSFSSVKQHFSLHQFKEGEFSHVIKVESYKYTKTKLEIEYKNERYVFYLSDQTPTLQFGDLLKVTGEYQTPSKNTVPNLFNYQKYLITKKITAYGIVDQIEVLKHQPNLRDQIRNKFFTYSETLKADAYYKALILGYKSDLDKKVIEMYNLSGVSHLLSLSGLHVGLLAFVISKVMNKLFSLAEIVDVMIITTLFCYAYLSFASVSIYRATIMYSLILLNKRMDLKIHPIDTLFIAGSIILLMNPLEILNTGFHFSFIIVLFILMSKPYIKSSSTLFSLLKVSLIAFLSSVPIVLALNFELYLLSPIVNLLVIPIFSLFVYPLTLISFVIPLFDNILVFVLKLFNQIIELSYFESMTVILGKMKLMTAVVFYIILILSIKRRRAYIIVFFIYLFMSPYLNPSAHVYYIDVGQGDSTLVITPFRKQVYLIDTGGIYYKKDEFTISKYKTIPLLKSLGIRSIDYLVLTHGDFDHMGEAEYMLESFSVKNLIINCNKKNDLELKLATLYEDKLSSVDSIQGATPLSCRDYEGENDSSIALSFDFNGKTFYFGGDLHNGYQDRFKFHIDVLKLSHHGSKTSTSTYFLDHTSPSIAVASVGRNNLYGHPHKVVRDMLLERKISFYRTDLNGTTYIRVSNRQLIVKTFERN